MKTRPEALRAIESRSFDVCVIGAGATGAGCALDAQLRGLQTVLLDAGDFAGATSGASTKLVHGGVRYLQQAVADFDLGQLQVVREALRERVLMLENAPYLAHRREFLVPCFSRYEVIYYALGLKLYDWFAGNARLAKSRVLTRPQATDLCPTLKSDRVCGAVAYQDGQFDDARYGITLVRTFTDAGGEAVNYLRVVGFEKDAGGRIAAAIVEDSFTAVRSSIHARAFVNATGPFSDHVRSLATPGAPSRLVLSKGVHILLPIVGDGTTALIIPKTEDGRVIFAIPWLGRLLVGTTDQEVPVDEEPEVSNEEAEYLLRHLNRYSTVQYSVDDIVSAFCGVRPLVRAKHARQTKKLIREHEVEADESSGLISILGGKWTTYRAMAEDTIDVVQKQLGLNQASSTSQHRLAGVLGYHPDDWRLLASEHSLSEPTAKHLLEKFGGEAPAVLALAVENPELKSPIVTGATMIQVEIVYCARQEMSLTIEDVLARRIGLQLFSMQLSMGAAPVVAMYLARELGWSSNEKDRAVREYVNNLEHKLRLLRTASA